jgi:hypothetical protein
MERGKEDEGERKRRSRREEKMKKNEKRMRVPQAVIFERGVCVPTVL